MAEPPCQPIKQGVQLRAVSRIARNSADHSEVRHGTAEALGLGVLAGRCMGYPRSTPLLPTDAVLPPKLLN